MKLRRFSIFGVVEITPDIYSDKRGWFYESYKQNIFQEKGLDMIFLQDNQSFSKKGVLRGLHFQKPPHAQGKLISVLSGKILDVIVDIRKSSPSFGQHLKVILDAKRKNMLYFEEGFAHGFLALEDTHFFYKCNNYYNKASESGIRWDDPTLNIDWGIADPIVSSKDEALPLLEDIRYELTN